MLCIHTHTRCVLCGVWLGLLWFWCGTVESSGETRPGQAHGWITAPLIGGPLNICEITAAEPANWSFTHQSPIKCCYQLTKWSRLQVKQIISLRVTAKRGIHPSIHAYELAPPSLVFTTWSWFPLCGQFDFPMNYHHRPWLLCLPFVLLMNLFECWTNCARKYLRACCALRS